MCHSSTRPGTSYHVTQFYQAFPRVSIASDKRWVRRPGYEARSPLGRVGMTQQRQTKPGERTMVRPGSMAQTINIQGCTQWCHCHPIIPLTPNGVSDTSDMLFMTEVTMLLVIVYPAHNALSHIHGCTCNTTSSFTSLLAIMFHEGFSP